VHVASGVYRETVQVVSIHFAGPSGHLNITGDETTVPNETTDTNVRISGSDDDNTPTRSIGLLVMNCMGVVVKGITVDHCAAYGFAASYITSRFINCKARNNALDGFSIGGGNADCTPCVSVQNGRHGFDLTEFTHVSLTNCASKNNGNDGVYGSTAWISVSAGSYQNNAYNGINVDESSLVRFTSAPTCLTRRIMPSIALVETPGQIFTRRRAASFIEHGLTPDFRPRAGEFSPA
jgi:hypothetical protein